jgi:UPF0755 protein
MDFLRQSRLWVGLCLLVLAFGGYELLVAPPGDFPTHAILSITKGESSSDVAAQFADAHIVAHASVLRLVLRLSGASVRVQAGTYLFESKESVFTIARRLSSGAYGLPPVSLTFPEGVTVRDIAEKVSETLSPSIADGVTSLGKTQEGYLFPDTYNFSADATADSILKTMRANFDAKTAPLAADVHASGHAFADIVTLAALVEKEARTDENRRIVAGVLWNRLAKKMPLQVDAVFGYINNRDTYSPSYADLKIDSPYNTYTHTGLPPGPICNPGLVSILAALHPTVTKYLYYLTDRNGVMHYATTFAEHQTNQEKYLH